MSANKAIRRQPGWKKFEAHSYVRAIDANLRSLGFEFSKAHQFFLTWTRPVFDRADTFITLLPQRGSKGCLQFGVNIGVESTYLMEVENNLKTWECGMGMFSPDAFPYKEPIAIIRVALHWLLLNANPPETTRLSWSGSEADAQMCAVQLRDDIINYVFPFLRQADAPEKLVDLLRNIDNHPRRLREPGLSSPDPGGYAALLLHQFGRTDEALKELEIASRERTAKYERMWRDDPQMRDQNIKTYACTVQRIRQFLLQGSIG